MINQPLNDLLIDADQQRQSPIFQIGCGASVNIINEKYTKGNAVHPQLTRPLGCHDNTTDPVRWLINFGQNAKILHPV